MCIYALKSGNIRYIVEAQTLKWQQKWQQTGNNWQQSGNILGFTPAVVRDELWRGKEANWSAGLESHGFTHLDPPSFVGELWRGKPVLRYPKSARFLFDML